MPMSLPARVNYATSILPRHQSPFETLVDNAETSEGLEEPGAKQYRHAGPWLAGQTDADFMAYLKDVSRRKPELMQKLRERYCAKRVAERRKQAQDSGEDLEALKPPTVTEEEFQRYVKSLREDSHSLGIVIFELLDLPSPPAVPNERIGGKYYQPPVTKLSSPEYAVFGPPMTHPSGGLSYTRSHAVIYNHPKYGPQGYQKPVEARILRPKGKFKGWASKAIAGVGGIAVEDLNAMTFVDQGTPPGLSFFDASIPGGGKYWVTPIRASVDSQGRISLSSYRASASTKAPYGIEDYKNPDVTSITHIARSQHRVVPRLDRTSSKPPRFKPSAEAALRQPMKGTEDIASNLMKALSPS